MFWIGTVTEETGIEVSDLDGRCRLDGGHLGNCSGCVWWGERSRSEQHLEERQMTKERAIIVREERGVRCATRVRGASFWSV